MELAFILSALRRYFWIVVLFGLLGAVPGLFTFRGGEELYESRTVLVITPPVQAGAVAGPGGDSDRYIAGEISVMQSLSDSVSDRVEGVSAGQLEQWVSFLQQPLTNVVVVAAKAPTPELAQEIAQAYSDTYFEVLSAQLQGSVEPALEAVESEIAVVQEELRTVDRQLAEAVAPFLDRGVAASAELVAPSLASDREFLVVRFNELSARRAELNTGLRISSRVIREPSLSELPLSSSNRLLVVAGGIAGAFAGLVLALIAARLSRRVNDDEQVVELLGHPVLGTMPRRPVLVRDRTAMLGEVSSEAARFLDSLGVRVEAASENVTTTVLVCGVAGRTGTTTVAASLARQLAVSGANVLLVDADRRHSELTDLFGRNRTVNQGLIETSLPNLRMCDLASLGQVVDTHQAPSTRRRDLSEVIGAIHSGVDADVVVFDGGPLMEAASTVTLSRLCDVVVLTMPQRLSVRALETVASELAARDHVLPIWVSIMDDQKGRGSKRVDTTSVATPAESGPAAPPPVPVPESSDPRSWPPPRPPASSGTVGGDQSAGATSSI